MRRFHSYTAYTVGCVIAWAIVLLVVQLVASDSKKKVFLYVFAGWVIGWTSATIARRVYPPPRRRESP